MLELTTNKSTGQILRELRENTGLSLRKFGKEINIAYSEISLLERDMCEVSFKTLKKYHDYFNVSYEYILGESQDYSSTDTGKASTLERKENYNLRRMQQNDASFYEVQTMKYLLNTPQGNTALTLLSKLLWGKCDCKKRDGDAFNKQISTESFIAHDKNTYNADNFKKDLEILLTLENCTESKEHIKVILNNKKNGGY